LQISNADGTNFLNYDFNKNNGKESNEAWDAVDALLHVKTNLNFEKM